MHVRTFGDGLTTKQETFPPVWAGRPPESNAHLGGSVRWSAEARGTRTRHSRVALPCNYEAGGAFSRPPLSPIRPPAHAGRRRFSHSRAPTPSFGRLPLCFKGRVPNRDPERAAGTRSSHSSRNPAPYPRPRPASGRRSVFFLKATNCSVLNSEKRNGRFWC